MKKILMIAALAFIGFSAKAQDVENHSRCDVEYRQVCINPITCTVTYPSGLSWNLIAASPTPPSTAPLTIASCGGGVVGFEVRYASSTGCNNTPITVVAGGSTSCPGTVVDGRMGACSCTTNMDGLDVTFDGSYLRIHGS